MDESALFDEICALLAARGIELRTERFVIPPDSAGGLCRVAGKDLVLLHAGASRAERVQALLEVVEQLGLRRLGIRGAQLSPTLLSRLNRRGQMPWPHRSQAPPVAKAQTKNPPKDHLKLVMMPPALSLLTTLGVGGPPLRFETATTEGDVIDLARAAQKQEDQLYVLGGGSNVVVADEGIPGTVLRMGLPGISTKTHKGQLLVTAGAGVVWDDFVAEMTEQDYAGIECLAGIPGSVGATPIQNVGAYGQEVSQVIDSVRVLNRKTLKFRDLSNKQCCFAYRSSLFKTSALDEYIVISVTFRLVPGGRPTLNYPELKKAIGDQVSLKELRAQVIELRRAKSMVYDPADENHRSCGSFFVNAQMPADEVARLERQLDTKVPTFPGENAQLKVPAAWLIERAGFQRGFRRGHVGLSSKHTLCIVAHEGAQAREVVEFAASIRDTVNEKFAIRLVPEPNFWGFPTMNQGLPQLSR